MARSIVLTAAHDLGVDLAKQRITDRYEQVKAAWIDKIGGAEMRWVGDVAHISARALGQNATATIDVQARIITISIVLPMILAPFGGAIEAFLKDNADALQSTSKKA